MAERGFLRENARWLGAGAGLAFASSFGQTFYLALFGPEIRAELGLSHGEWGGIYTVATLAAAATLMASGGLVDRYRVRWLAPATLVLMALAAAVFAGAQGVVALGLAIYALRFLGQGFCGHLSVTATARWFAARRGRALAVAGLGYSAGEAVLPGLAVAVAAFSGWRGAWLASAALLLAAAPLMCRLLAAERTPQSVAHATEAVGMGGRHWTRAEATRHWVFWALTPGLLGPPFIGTTIFFQQAHLAAEKAWSLVAVAAALPVYAGVTIAVSFAAGALVDRLGARRLLPFYQAPMGLGALALALMDHPVTPFLAYGLCGATSGAAVAVLGALWPEVYGTRWLGSIRSAVMSALIFATALGPGLSGALIDAGLAIEAQLVALALWAFATCAGYGMLAARLKAATAAQAA